jgi:hypothetical protein
VINEIKEKRNELEVRRYGENTNARNKPIKHVRRNDRLWNFTKVLFQQLCYYINVYVLKMFVDENVYSISYFYYFIFLTWLNIFDYDIDCIIYLRDYLYQLNLCTFSLW